MGSSSSPMVMTIALFTETEILFVVKVIYHREAEFKKNLKR